MNPEEVIAYELKQQGKKTPAAVQKAYLEELVPVLEDIGISYVMVGDSDYFKTITGMKQSEANLGYVFPVKYPDTLTEPLSVLYTPNYRQVFYNPEPTRRKIQQAFEALLEHMDGSYEEPGTDIIKTGIYLYEPDEIEDALQELLDENIPLAADIETFSLKHYDAGIGTITFCWNKHEGLAFPVDLGSDPIRVRKALKNFFTKFKNKIIWHRASFDVYVLVYQLWMNSITDTEGLLEGLEIMLRNVEDSLLVTYLATNSCAGNVLGLKQNSQEFTGNYAIEEDEITDIGSIPLNDLLKYNLIDGLATWYVWDKYHPIMIQDDQKNFYETIAKPALYDIIQMQLTGMPLDMDRVLEVSEWLEQDMEKALDTIQNHRLVNQFNKMMNEDLENERYANWEERKARGVRVREYTSGNFDHKYNPNSDPQCRKLFYEMIGLPILDKTKSGQASTSGDALEKLKAYTEDPGVLELLNAHLEHAKVSKVVTAFIPHMKEAIKGDDGVYYLFGNFNLGGTVSFRLSSSQPNLQQIPARGDYAEWLKSCFIPPKGWLLVGLDFHSLEDKISALTTRDPAKLKVYTDGYDGHSLRAHSYFSERMPDIEMAPEGARCFRAVVNNTVYLFHEHEQIKYNGQTMTGLELWKRLENVRI